MRIHFEGTAQPTALAKALKAAFLTYGHQVGIRICEQHVAGMTGYANWHELQKVSKRHPQRSPDDRVAGPEVAYARREQYVGFLEALYGTDTAVALVDAIRPTGDAEGPADEADPVDHTVPSPDGTYPFAYAHRVKTGRGEVLVRSRGIVRIPSGAPGSLPVFRGDFIVHKETSAPRPLLTRLEIHAVEDGLFSRVEPLLGSRLPSAVGQAADLVDTLLWSREPPCGVAGNPMYQALGLARLSPTGDLRDHVCPPGWAICYDNGIQEPNFIQSALYGGLRGSPPGTGIDVMDRRASLRAAGPPVVMDEAALSSRSKGTVVGDGDRIRADIARAAEGMLALVDGEVMTRTPEPCWKLTMSRDGTLGLDLYLSRYLRGRDGHEPTLFFALDEEEARDRAIEALLGFTGRPGTRTRGTLDSYEPSACRIDGTASSLAHLSASMRETLSQAAQVLSDQAAPAALGLRSLLPVEAYPSLMGFKPRQDRDVAFPEGVTEAWTRLTRLAGGAITLTSQVPCLARLASQGVFLRYLAIACDQGQDVPESVRI